ncbi:hypothetical protein SDC9_177480 [bioreactor metagenome]|uniref:Uncharacterized protein n=1 Tax=bioreactor metagenome TaxID=1076179 RepID=A0A645H2F1_9ZZZZ
MDLVAEALLLVCQKKVRDLIQDIERALEAQGFHPLSADPVVDGEGAPDEPDAEPVRTAPAVGVSDHHVDPVFLRKGLDSVKVAVVGGVEPACKHFPGAFFHFGQKGTLQFGTDRARGGDDGDDAVFAAEADHGVNEIGLAENRRASLAAEFMGIHHGVQITAPLLDEEWGHFSAQGG